MLLEIADEHLPAFVASLAAGTLEAIRRGALDAAAGTRTLGAPRLWKPLAGKSPLLDRVAEVLARCDELDATKLLGPEPFAAELERLTARLMAVLAEQSEWSARWKAGTSG